MVVANGSVGISKLLSDIYPEELGHLYPSDNSLYTKVINLEVLLERELGAASTDWAFGNLLLTGRAFSSHLPTAASSINQGSVDRFIEVIIDSEAPWLERMIWRLLGKPFLLPLMISANNVSSDRIEASLEVIHRVFRQMDELLLRNNPEVSVTDRFLLATDKPTAADFTFAAMSIPVLLPEQTSRYMLSYDKSFIMNNNNNNNSSTIAFNGRDTSGYDRMMILATQLRSTYKSAQYAIKLYDYHRFPDKSN